MAIEPKIYKRTNYIPLWTCYRSQKRSEYNEKQSFETHVHEDVEKLGGKVDKIYWVLLAAAGTVSALRVGKNNYNEANSKLSFRESLVKVTSSRT
jgi:hypothetical protein